MANKSEKSKIKSSRVYVVAGIIYAILLVIGIAGVATVFTIRQNIATDTETALTSVYTIKSELLAINEKSIMTIAKMGDANVYINDIRNSFDIIDENMKTYESLDSHSDKELKRYNRAKVYINALRTKLKEYVGRTDELTLDQARDIYIQEFAPYQISATEMFDATIDINKETSEEQIHNSKILFRIVWGTMAGSLILGEIAIIIISKIDKANRLALEKKTQQAEAAANKFKHSQQKMSDIAYTNILTNMKNRYALDADLTDKLDSEQMYIAAFDLDNFRSVNDTYGYDFGDEYLAQIAEKLKKDFSQYAEVYNITGNEFCFVFNSDVSDASVRQITNNILMAMTSPYNIANLVVQLNASGSIYHYQPGDCLNTSSLLVKLDSVLRNVKRNGGNAIYEVNVY